jgi:hypothetical protein
MLRQPADAPAPLPHIRASEHFRELHEGWARVHGEPSTTSVVPPVWQRFIRKLRRFLPYSSGERELIGVLIRTADSIALRCDEIADRLAAQESLTEDVTESFGADLTQLRSELIRFRTVLPGIDPPSP